MMQDIIKAAATNVHANGHGKNFKSLVAAGSWKIVGFRAHKTRCACCGRPIVYALQLKNEAYEVSNAFPETVEVGMVCGPKVFLESCVGFYSDPGREWERQHKAWKDFINYVIVCVKHEAMWALIPEAFRKSVDEFLEEGYKTQEHSGGWWMVRTAKRRYLTSQADRSAIPPARALRYASRGLVYAGHKQGLLSADADLVCSNDGVFSLQVVPSVEQSS